MAYPKTKEQPIPAFDPNKPYTPVKQEVPEFDPNKPFTEVKKKPTSESGSPEPLDGGLNGTTPKTELPTIELYKTNKGDLVEPDPISMVNIAGKLAKEGKREMTIGEGAERGVFTPDAKSVEESQTIIKDLEKQGFKKDFVESVSDLPEVALNNPTTSKEKLVSLYKENPIKFKQLTNEAKNKYAIADGASKKAYSELEGNKDRDETSKNTGILEGNLYSGDDVTPPENMQQFYSTIKQKQDLINKNIDDPEQKKKAQERLKETYSSAITPSSLDFKEEYANSGLADKLDINQYAGLKTLELFEPEKAKNLLNIVNDNITTQWNVNVPTSPETSEKIITADSAFASKLGGQLSQLTINQRIGKEEVLRELSNMGANNEYDNLTSEQTDLKNQYQKATTDEEKMAIYQKSLSNEERIKQLEKTETDNDKKYPLTAKLKYENQVKELVNDRGIGVGGYMLNKYSHGVGSGVDAAENLVTSIFGSDADKTKLRMKRIGEGKQFEASVYLPEGERRTGSPVILQASDELKKKAKEILNGRSLSSLNDEEKQKLSELVSNSQDQIKTITNPEAGKSKNFWSKATGMSVAGFTSDIGAFLTKMALLKGGGMGTKAAEATTLFTDGYDAAFNQKINEGASTEAANEYGILHGAVLSLMTKFGSKYENIMNVVKGGKSPISKYISGLSEESWNKLAAESKPLLSKIGSTVKGVAKEQGKMIGTFGVVAPTASSIADNVFYDDNKSAGEMTTEAFESAKEMLIGSVGFIGLGLAKGVMKGKATPLEKAALWEIGDNPEIGKARIDEAVKANDLTKEEGEKRKEIVDNVSKLIDQVPETNDKGKPLNDQQRANYLFNLSVKESYKDKAKNLPEKQAAEAKQKSLVADKKNQLELESLTFNQLNDRKDKLEASISKVDEKGKPELSDKEMLDAKAELEAVNDGIENISAKTADENVKKLTEPKGEPEQITKPIELKPEITNEEPKVQQPTEVTSITEEKVGEPALETEKEATPKEPSKPVEEEGDGDKFKDKGILNRLFKAENTPKEAREGFEKQGLKYEPQSVQEAEQIGKAMVDQYGIDDAVTLAETNKFKGGVNSAIFAESLNRLYEQEAAAKTPQEKIEIAKKFAEVGIRYDDFSRGQGRDIKQISHFYKKSPLGVHIMENARRREDFEQWSKPKEKTWREFFDDMMKEPEFEKEVSAKVKEEMKKERAEARSARIKKVDEFFDKAKKEFEGGAAYSTIIPPKIITAAIDGMKMAYHGGEKVVELVQKAIDYISEQLGHETWNKEKFRKEWEGKLKDKTERKPLTDEEIKAKILDRFRKKLKGLTDKEKEEVIRKSFHKIVESGGLDYADFKNIIADITGRGELTPEEAARLKELVKETNSVDEAGEKARTERTPESRKKYFEAQTKAAKASKELNEILYNRPNIIKRLTSIMQLNTLGIPALVNNPIYNIVNQIGLRLPVGLIKTGIDQVIRAGSGGKIKPDTQIVSLTTQAEFFKKLGLGTKEAFEQFATGLNRADYTAKEIQGQQIRPATSIRDLWQFFKGKKNLTNEQAIDKTLQATVGIPAEIVARTLNLGDKPQRFAAEGAQASAFAKALGLKDIDYDLFIDFPREEALMQYKKKGLSDVEAAKKADYIADTIIKEGQRSTFQQDNMLTDVINRAFGGEQSGIGSLAKAVAISPYIKIPSNAYWSYYNLINPEVAFLQSMIYGAKAAAKKSGEYTKFLGDKYNTSAAKDLNEAKYWFAHGAVGMATRAVIVSLVGAGIARPSNTGDDTKKEREGEQNYEQQGTINVSKLSAAIKGENPDDVKNGLNVQMRWFGHWGTMADAIARKEEAMIPEQRDAQEGFWSTTLGGMEIDALKELNQGVFGGTSSLLTAIERKDFQNYGVNLINMFTNIVQPAALAQMERAAMPYYTKQKADTFLGELNNTMLTRSKLYRDLTNQYPPSKVGIWGDKVEKSDNFGMRLFGISKAKDDNFAQPIYEDYKKTGNTKFLPPSVQPLIRGNNEIVKLQTKDAARLEELVGQQRKNLVAPYINDMATFAGIDKKYSQLSDEEKIKKLDILYEEGFKNGKAIFLKENPQYVIPEKTKEEKRTDKRESRANRKFRKSVSSNF